MEESLTNWFSFREKAKAKLSYEAMGVLLQLQERVFFKLKAARYFLRSLEELDQQPGRLASQARDEVDLNLDCFLYEVVGTVEPLLQQINLVFNLNMGSEQVNMNRVISRLPAKSKLKDKLRKLDTEKQEWFWKLRDYRNHSAHRGILNWHIAVIAGGREEQRSVWLRRDPRDPNSGSADEKILEYCQNSIERMKGLLSELYGICEAEV